MLLVSSNQQTLIPFFYQLFTPVYFLGPACFYLYIANFVNGRTRFDKSDWLHFIPAVLALIHVLPLPFSPSKNWDVITGQIIDNRMFYGYLFVSVDLGNDAVEEVKELPESALAVAPASKKVNLMPDQVSVYADSMKSFMENKAPYFQKIFRL